jgi:hypothetical protein
MALIFIGESGDRRPTSLDALVELYGPTDAARGAPDRRFTGGHNNLI